MREVQTYEPRYPDLVVDLSKADYAFGPESKVHGQMKAHGMGRELRREFTAEIQQARTWGEQIEVCRRWVTVTETRKRRRHGGSIPVRVARIATVQMAHLGATHRISKRGVPHILVDIAGVLYSCCYFGRTDTWRVFWPSMVFAEKQHKVTFNRSPNMITWLECEKARKELEVEKGEVR